MVQRKSFMNEPIRILQVFGVMNQGGAESMIMNLYRAINRSEIQFDFVVHREEKGAFDDEINALGGKIYHCPAFSLHNYKSYKKWWNDFFLSHEEYKIIHSHIRSCASVFLKISKKYNVVSIVHSHSTSNGKGFKSIVKRIMQRGIKKYSDYFFACSIKAGEWLYGRKIIKEDRFYVLRNAINLDDYVFNKEKRAYLRRSLSVEGNVVYIHIGRFHESKNHTFLISVFESLHKLDNNSKLILVGDGTLKQKIVNLVDSKGLNDSVLFLGLRNDVPELFMAADCFVFPSIWEGLPVTVVEAQASGIPCYVSDSITKEVKLVESIHFLSLKDGAKEWANAIFNSNLRRSNSCSSVGLSDYDVRKTANWLEDFYKRIVL